MKLSKEARAGINAAWGHVNMVRLAASKRKVECRYKWVPGLGYVDPAFKSAFGPPVANRPMEMTDVFPVEWSAALPPPIDTSMLIVRPAAKPPRCGAIREMVFSDIMGEWT